MTKLINWIGFAWSILHANSRWMAWNLFLAFIPLVLSVWLFRRKVHSAPSSTRQSLRSTFPSPIWWLGLIVFVAFLPNAPYILTDVIHLVEDIRFTNSIWLITLVVIPQHLLFILAGFEAYVLSLINLGYYLHRRGWSQFILGAELLTHTLSAVGIYLGRFLRFNSWDLMARPKTLADSILDDVVGKRPLVIIVITIVVIAGLYWLMKQVTLALATYRKSARAASTSSNPN